jgi:hypothetical protein
MVVVERARDRVGSEVPVRVTSVLTTANGRLVFGRLTDTDAAAPTPLRSRRASPSSMPVRRTP